MEYFVDSNVTTRNEFMAVIEPVDGLHSARCPEIPGVEGRGRTKMAALAALGDAVARVFNDRRARAVQAASKDAIFESIRVA